MTLVIGKWSIAAIVMLVTWVWFAISASQSQGDYDFGPAIVGFVLVVGTIALWAGLVAGAFL